MLQSVLASLLVLALASSAPSDLVPDEHTEGLVVLEAPAPGSPADVGLLPGDVLVSWRRGDSMGLLRWPSGLLEVETEQAPRGPVVLGGRRGDRPMTWPMPAARWGARTRPALSPHLRALYREGAQRFAAGDPDGGAESWRAAVEAATRADDPARTAWFLGEIGRGWGAAWSWKESDAAYEEAIRRAKGTAMEAFLLREWGATFLRRELWDRARECFRRALALAPRESFAAAQDLASLAGIATRQGDLDAAERLYRQTLEIRSGLAVTGPYLMVILRSEIAGLGISAPRGSSSQEIEELRRKLEHLKQTLLDAAGLASAAQSPAPPKREVLSALEVLQRALAKDEREAPGSLKVADHWQVLGELAFADGDLAGAEIAWLRALDLRERLAPGTLREAKTLRDLGRVHAQAGRDRAAASFLCRAAEALDRRNRRTLDDFEARTTLGEEPAAYDQDCIAALVAARRPEDAFHALERSRVRGTLPAAPDLARRRQEIEAERAQTLLRLGRLSTSRDRDEVDLLLGSTEELEAQRDKIAASVQLDRLRAALPPGSLLFAWSIGDEESFLFAVRPAGTQGPGVEVFPLAAAAADLRNRVRRFAREVEKADAEPGRSLREAAELYRLLLAPAEELLAISERLVLLPDEVLAPLPFGSLVQGEVLLEKRKRIETAASATAWASGRGVNGTIP
ncbi:MAG TPA: tetratricopeptide repeat protein [Thermoanaerobaculia bacterium]|nr:tetratricopeptide repeat protein [Thermoanaerobaculia bacterium]